MGSISVSLFSQLDAAKRKKVVMKIILKSKRVNPNISVEFAVGLGWIANEWEAWALGEFTITSLKDGIHSSRSKHKWNKPADEPGEAADIRTWGHQYSDGTHTPGLIRFAKHLQKAGFGVVVHPDWLPGTPHLHVHLKKPIFKVGGR